MLTLTRFCASLFALLLVFGPARADEVVFPALGDTLPGGSKATYLDLVGEIVADATISPEGTFTGSKVKPMRHISGSAVAPPEKPVMETGISALSYDDGRRMLLLFELGRPEGDAAAFTVLALYDLSAATRLLDAVNVGYDQSNFFLNPAMISLGGGHLVQTLSVHFNSSQAYQATALTLLRDDRFDLVDDIFTFDDKHCGFERAQRIAIGAEPSEATLADIKATVTEIVTHTDAACDGEERPPAGERAIDVTYAWNAEAGRYIPDSDAFDVLATENEGRF